MTATASTPSPQAETRSFQAETAKILDLMIHSVYASRDVFLRELISNASDAIDKTRFLALTDAALRADGDHDYRIVLRPDEQQRTLEIEDNGIGMSYDEVVENIGTIARSGTGEFLAKLEEARKAGDMALIGRFGVGFYSSFIVADRVVLETWKFGEEHGVRWESDGKGAYHIERTPPRRRGTRIVLHLRKLDDSDDSARDFCQSWVLRETVRKHSDFVAFPIVLETWRDEPERDADGKVVEGGNRERKLHCDTLNRQKPLWTRDPKDVSDDEHAEFYRHLCHDWAGIRDKLHVRAEGMQEFIALLYVPEQAPFDLYAREAKRGLSLYVRNVFVMDQCRELLPEYMRFVRGLVDSPDLPLNVSRETVQQDRRIAAIRKVLVKKLWDRFAANLRDDRSKYEDFWKNYGPVLQEVMHYEQAQQDKLEACLLLRTTHNDGWSTLEEILARKVEGQEKLYFLVGEELATLRAAPHLEEFRARGVEVLLFSQPIEQVAFASLEKLGGLELADAADPELDLGDLGRKGDDAAPADTSDMEPLLTAFGAALADQVEAVRASRRLRDSAAVLVAAADAPSPAVERMMRAMGQALPERKQVLELNPQHPLVQRLQAWHSAHGAEAGADSHIARYATLLADQARIAAGDRPRDPMAFVGALRDVMQDALGEQR